MVNKPKEEVRKHQAVDLFFKVSFIIEIRNLNHIRNFIYIFKLRIHQRSEQEGISVREHLHVCDELAN